MKRLPLLLLLFMFSCANSPAEETVEETVESVSVDMATSSDSLLRHTVLFSFKEDSYPAGVNDVETAFRSFPMTIPEIHSFEWGTNNSPEGLDKGFTHLFFVTFKSEADREVYLAHPTNKAFIEILRLHVEDVVVLDYWAKQ